MIGPRTVWLASYPKSGNTWVRAVMMALAGSSPGAGPRRDDLRRRDDLGLDINALAGGPIASSRWALDARLGFASSDLLPGEIDALRPACDAAFDAELDQIWFRKIHDALFTGVDATPIVAPASTRAAVYLVRDPRDVAVSFAHFSSRTPAWAVEWMAHHRTALAAGTRQLTSHVRQRLGTWSDHVGSWTGHDLFPVSVLRYEDLHADPVGEFGRLAAFAGLTASREEVAAAVAAASFERLREQEAQRGFREQRAAASAFFRRGIVGGWRDELSSDLARRIESDHGPTMARLGYRPG